MESNVDVEKMSVDELLSIYSQIIKSLKNRNVIRTKNFVGEIGEYLAIRYYNNTPNLPNLQAAPVGTENIDAISRAGKRYSIKTVTGKTTGVFTDWNPKTQIKKMSKNLSLSLFVYLTMSGNYQRYTKLIGRLF